MKTVHVSALNIYPVKSLAGIALEAAHLTHAGLEYQGISDRHWIICRDDDSMLTQRKEPKMATIQTRIDGGVLHLHHRDTGTIALPSTAEVLNSNSHAIKVWKDACPALLAPSEINAWLTDTLKSSRPLKAYCRHPQQPRAFAAPERFKQVFNGFADAAPYLIANQASLDALNSHLASLGKQAVDMRRFRANLVVKGLEAFDEHAHQQLSGQTTQGEGFSLRLIDHCQRCIMTTVDPDTGRYDSQAHPFADISAVNAMPSNPKAPAFGVNATFTATHDNSGNSPIHVGDTLTF